MEQINIEKLKKIELNMLLVFLKICQKYNLTYYLIGGTCLGAVRHQGFIPWDDDIDVGMPRKDYERFLTIAGNELPENIFLQTGKSDPNYPMNFAKLRDSATTFIETSVKDIKMNHGCYLDIFPLDVHKPSRRFEFLNKIYLSRIDIEFKNYKQQRLKNRIIRIVVKIFIPNYRTARNRRDSLLSRYKDDNCDMVANYCGAWGKKEICPKEWFGDGRKMNFEGIEVIVPEKYELYLRQLYGNYMELPPVEKRISHHYCEIIDLNNTYEKYS